VFSAVVLFLVVAAISLLLPSHVRISRAINIQAAPLKIWAQVDDMRRWKQWNPFFSQLDSGRIHYVDSINGRPVLMEIAGTSVKWQEIKSDERVAVLQKEGKTSLINGWKCITGPSSGSTTLQWFMDFKLRWYPWEKFASLSFERSYGSRMEQGLKELKNIVEADRLSRN
jgi:hypothetical protein